MLHLHGPVWLQATLLSAHLVRTAREDQPLCGLDDTLPQTAICQSIDLGTDVLYRSWPPSAMTASFRRTPKQTVTSM